MDNMTPLTCRGVGDDAVVPALTHPLPAAAAWQSEQLRAGAPLSRPLQILAAQGHAGHPPPRQWHSWAQDASCHPAHSPAGFHLTTTEGGGGRYAGECHTYYILLVPICGKLALRSHCRPREASQGRRGPQASPSCRAHSLQHPQPVIAEIYEKGRHKGSTQYPTINQHHLRPSSNQHSARPINQRLWDMEDMEVFPSESSDQQD
ncbi:hypothetical protein F7725_017598, partial [Dissostichus mawsoni]